MLTFVLLGAAIILGAAFIILLAAIYFRRIVPTNMVHIVQSAKRTTAYGKDKPSGNSYFEWPSYLPIIGVSVTTFPESIFQVSLSNYPAYDTARLPFEVDVAAFFKVQDAAMVAQRVSSFAELTAQLHQVIQGAVRRILATNTLEAIMESRSSLANQFTEEVSADIKEWGVLPVKNIEFMDLRDVTDSEVIRNIMRKEKSRIEMESRVTVAQNTKEAELVEIDAKRTVEVQKQDAAEQIGIRTAEKDKAVGVAAEKTKQDITVQARETADKQMDVTKLTTVRQAEIERDAAEVAADQDRKVAEIKAQQDKVVKMTAAEATKQASILVAEGALVAAKNDAEGSRAKGIAAADAEQAMLMAPVNSQITLAKEIGDNQGYQTYLVTLQQIDANRDVGIEMAKSLQQADLKVISNAGDVQSGVGKIVDLFTTTGGTKVSGMLAALAQTDEGKALVEGITKRIKGDE